MSVLGNSLDRICSKSETSEAVDELNGSDSFPQSLLDRLDALVLQDGSAAVCIDENVSPAARTPVDITAQAWNDSSSYSPLGTSETSCESKLQPLSIENNAVSEANTNHHDAPPKTSTLIQQHLSSSIHVVSPGPEDIPPDVSNAPQSPMIPFVFGQSRSLSLPELNQIDSPPQAIRVSPDDEVNQVNAEASDSPPTLRTRSLFATVEKNNESRTQTKISQCWRRRIKERRESMRMKRCTPFPQIKANPLLKKEEQNNHTAAFNPWLSFQGEDLLHQGKFILWRQRRNSYPDWKIIVSVTGENRDNIHEVHEYEVHKCYLATGPLKSAYFNYIFQVQGDSQAHTVIHLRPQAASSFPVFLDYMYTCGDMLNATSENAAAVISLGCFFGVSKLCDDVYAFVESDITWNNAKSYYQSATEFLNQRMKEMVVDKILCVISEFEITNTDKVELLIPNDCFWMELVEKVTTYRIENCSNQASPMNEKPPTAVAPDAPQHRVHPLVGTAGIAPNDKVALGCNSRIFVFGERWPPATPTKATSSANKSFETISLVLSKLLGDHLQAFDVPHSVFRKLTNINNLPLIHPSSACWILDAERRCDNEYSLNCELSPLAKHCISSLAEGLPRFQDSDLDLIRPTLMQQNSCALTALFDELIEVTKLETDKSRLRGKYHRLKHQGRQRLKHQERQGSTAAHRH